MSMQSGVRVRCTVAVKDVEILSEVGSNGQISLDVQKATPVEA